MKLRRKKKRECFHHDYRSGESWIEERVADVFSIQRIYWCRGCGQSWWVDKVEPKMVER